MTILVNTDKNTEGSERLENFVTTVLSDELSRYESYITRVEVHLSDENADKEGGNDKRCILESRLKNKKPIAVTSYADTSEKALNLAIDKLMTSIETILSREGKR